MTVSIAEQGRTPEVKKLLREELKNLGYFCILPDICAAEGGIFLPGKAAFLNVILKRENVPPISFNLIESDWNNLDFLRQLLGLIDRSRGAQAGLITRALVLSPEELSKKGPFQKIDAQLEIKVIGKRPIKINEGEGVACLYSSEGAEMLFGENLWDVIGNGIKIEGDYGADWSLIGIKRGKYSFLQEHEADYATGVGLRLARYWHIPPSDKPIAPFSPRKESYRQFLNRDVLQPRAFNELQGLSFLVGETASSLTIVEGYNAVSNLAVKAGETYLLHTLANVLKGGRTDWPIRAELYLPPSEPNLPYQILMPKESDFANTWILIHIYEDLSHVDLSSPAGEEEV